jgi:mannose-1-phosphate guanylyltransferase/phosphomannomutase
VRLAPDDPQSVVVRFLDNEGSDITEDFQRKIERLFQREDYRRVLPEEIGDITFPPRAVEDYTLSLQGTVETGAIRSHRFKLVVDYSYGTTALVMPQVLARLDADVLAVHPYNSTQGVIHFDKVAAAEQVGALVRASGAHLGAVLDPDGERLTLIDDEGAVLSDTETLLAFVQLVCDHLLGDSIAVPVQTTMRAEELANAKGRRIRWTKTSTAALMDAASEHGVGFAADGRGGFILPGFMPSFDAAAALVKMLDLLARSGSQLSVVRDRLPRVHLSHETVVTPWEQKGLVMRTLVESATRDLVLLDGVKVLHDGGWVLALPDPEEPVTHVWSEAGSDSEARRLAQEYVRRIRQLVR